MSNKINSKKNKVAKKLAAYYAAYYICVTKPINMQSVKVISAINQAPKVQIEGVGTIRQIEVAEKLFAVGVIDWNTRIKAGKIALCEILVGAAINKFNLYPRQF